MSTKKQTNLSTIQETMIVIYSRLLDSVFQTCYKVSRGLKSKAGKERELE